MEPVYTPVIGACLAAFRLKRWRLHVAGTEHLPPTGGGVVATNHIGYLDFIVVGASAREQNRRRLRFLAKREIWDHPIAGPMMRSMQHIPVDRAGRAADSLVAAEEAIRRGELIGMFPESTISRSFVPLPGKSGAARMAIDTGTPLVPGAVWGTQRLWTKGRDRELRSNVDIMVRFGPPIPHAPDDDPAEVTERLMSAISDLLAGAQADYPHTPTAPDAWWLPAHLGGSAPTPEEALAVARREAEERAARHAARQTTGDAGPEPARHTAPHD